ncbi:MAG: sulfite exporter TauE/SafE family protein [Alphaproteobacteria bacterium]|nr:sulfite exporter TauE/SafE family protein [Alphaproteobacteria bacterium]
MPVETLSPLLIAAGLAILGLAGFVKGVTGIGIPFVAAPLIATFIGVPGTVMLLSIPILIANLWQSATSGPAAREAIRFWPLALALCVGTWVGSHLLFITDPKFLLGIFGIVVLVMAVLGFARPDARLPPRHEHWAGAATGTAAGILGGLTTLFGPPIVIYLSAVQLDRHSFVAIISTIYVVASGFLVVSLYAQDAYTAINAWQGALATVPVLLGVMVGQRIRGGINERLFRRLLMTLLVFAALNLLRRALY